MVCCKLQNFCPCFWWQCYCVYTKFPICKPQISIKYCSKQISYWRARIQTFKYSCTLAATNLNFTLKASTDMEYIILTHCYCPNVDLQLWMQGSNQCKTPYFTWLQVLAHHSTGLTGQMPRNRPNGRTSRSCSSCIVTPVQPLTVSQLLVYKCTQTYEINFCLKNITNIHTTKINKCSWTNTDVYIRNNSVFVWTTLISRLAS